MTDISNRILFTIIIPHRDCIDLLKRAIDSIPESATTQIIVVDNSLQEVADLSLFPDRENIEFYLSPVDGGAGKARNIGLEHAKGKWILFLDADDFFTEGTFDILNRYVDNDEDIIYFKMESCYSDTLEPASRGDHYSQMVDNYLKREPDSEEILRYKFVSPCAKMVRFSLIKEKDILFDEVIASNDVYFSLLSGHYAKKVLAVDFSIYCATMNRGSLTNRTSYEILKARYQVTLRYNQFLKKHNKGKFQNSVMYYLFSSRKYGIKVFCEFFYLCLLYRNNIFIGTGRWLSSYKKKKEYISVNQKYIVNN